MSDTALAPDPVREPGVRTRLGTIGWTGADQVLSSGTNAALTVLVARSVGAEQFGAFALALVVFVYAVGVVRALVSEPLVIRFAGAQPDERARAIADSAGAAVLVGTGLGLACVTGGAVVGGQEGSVILALGVLLPGLVLQDHWRTAFFASRRPRSAFANDAVWAVLQIGAVLTLTAAGRTGSVPYLLAWGGAAAVAAVVGAAQVRRRPQILGGLRWLADHRSMGRRLTGGFLVDQGAVQAVVLLLGAIVGLAAVGAVRGAQTLISPVRVLLATVSAVALPAFSSRVADGGRVLRPAVLVSLVAGSAAGAWAVAAVLVPDDVGRALLGDTWPGAEPLVGLVGTQWTAIAVATAFAIALKALARTRELLAVSVVQALLVVALGTAGALLADAVGALTGLVAGQVAGVLLLLWMLRPRDTTP